MRSDSKALVRVFLWAGVVAFLFMVWLVTAILLHLDQMIAVGGGLGLLVIGGMTIGIRFAAGLLQPPTNKHAESPEDAPDR